MSTKIHFFKIALLLLATSALMACAGNSVKKQGPEQTVVDRSKAKWAAIFAKDYETAYGMLTPGYRNVFDYVSYAGQIKRQPVKWRKAEVMSAECEQDICTVTVDLHFSIRSPQAAVGTISTHSLVYEKWLKSDDGDWYYAKKR